MSSSRSCLASLLPCEVLGHIFELGFPRVSEENKSPWNFSIRRCSEYHVSVSHVSRHFRNVAIHTPRLWTIIQPGGVSLEFDIAYVKMCLERSGSLLCTISLHYGDLFFKYPNLAICEIMTLVNSNIYRLERFFAKSPQIPILHQIMGYLNRPAPRLRTLELSYTFPVAGKNRPARHDFQFLLFGGQMPMLTTILLEGVSAFRWSGYNLENVTEIGLSFEGDSMHRGLRTLIKRTPLLRKLGIRGGWMAWRSRQTEDHSVVELNFLEFLEISYLGQEDAIEIISLIWAPILKSLILAGINDCSTLLDTISTQPQRFPNLVYLLLEHFKASNEAFTELLRVYPNLERLGLHIGSSGKSFVHLLEGTKSTGGLHLCPKLKTLCCYGFSLKHIQDVLAKRAEANIPLPKVELSRNMTRESPHYNPSALLWLRQNTQVEFVPIVLDDY